MLVLDDPKLGELELRSSPYCVIDFQIGSATPRPVMRNRALSSGAFDDTQFAGSRAITVSLMFNESPCAPGQPTMQQLYDRILPYMNVKRRPTLRWSLPGSGAERQTTVRGESAPVVITRAKHPVLVLSFVSADGEITSAGDPQCQPIDPAIDIEEGRPYDLTFNRSYPPSLAVGDRLVLVDGNEPAHWTLTIFGEVTDPFFKVNDTTIFTNLGEGVDLPADSNLVISTRDKTMYLNGNAADSRYDRTNFTAWTWSDLLLQPGENLVRFGAVVLGPGASALLCWRPTWAG
jgi:hypothetical protein